MGESACPNCDRQLYQVEVPGKGVVIICPEYGFRLVRVLYEVKLIIKIAGSWRYTHHQLTCASPIEGE